MRVVTQDSKCSRRSQDVLQNTIVDFVKDPVIAHANPPRIAAFESLYILRTRICFHSGEKGIRAKKIASP
jgi:hypothetical protein